MFQMCGLGPMFGQLGYFHHFSGKEIEDPRPKERYRAEVARLLKVLDGALQDRNWIAGDYSIADIAIAPWLRSLRDFYKAAEIGGWTDLQNAPAYLDRFLACPAVQRGLNSPSRELSHGRGGNFLRPDFIFAKILNPGPANRATVRGGELRRGAICRLWRGPVRFPGSGQRQSRRPALPARQPAAAGGTDWPPPQSNRPWQKD